MAQLKKPIMEEPSRRYDMFLGGAFQRDSTNIIYMPELHKVHHSIGRLVEERYGKTIYVPVRDVRVASANVNDDHKIWSQFTEAEINSELILANMDHYHEAHDLHIMLQVAMKHKKDIIAFYRGRPNKILDSMRNRCKVEVLKLRDKDDTLAELSKSLDQRFVPISEYPFEELTHLSA